MTVTIQTIDRGTTPGDGTGDTAYDGTGKINTNFTNLKTAVESLQGRHWTVQNGAATAALGKRYIANSHAGFALTMPTVFVASATAESDIWVSNNDDASDVTLTPGTGDAFFFEGASLGVDTTKALAPSEVAILSIRADNVSWDLIILNSGSGGFTSFLDDETYDNYAIGPGALDSITLGSGVDNIAIGRNAGTALTINDGNVIIGDEAGTGVDDEYNVIVGKGAGASCGWGNVILGYQALISGTSSASNNVIIGRESAGGATNPSGCVLIGYDVALDLTDAQDSICIGASAGDDLISGDYCIAIGKANRFSSATDDSQIIIGSVHDSTDSTQPFIKGYQPLTRLSTADNSGNNITITGSSARYNAPTYLDAGDLILQGGLAATTGIGIGGDLIIRGGAPGSTGTAGNAVIQDGADNTKQIKIDASGLTTATTRTLTIPDLDINLADEDFSVDVETVANQDYIMWWDAPWAGEVTKVRTKSQSGTCTLTGKVNTTALGGTANSVSTSAQEQTHSSSNTFSKGDKLLFTISSNSGCTDMAVIFYLKRT